MPSVEPKSEIPAIYRYFKDPISGLTHLLGAGLGVFGLYYLVSSSGKASFPQVISFIVFSISLILLYLASSAYHLLHVSIRARKVLRQIDHSMIYVFIAGTYTPFCIIPLSGKFGTGILVSVWIFAGVGVILKLVWEAPRWLSTAIYVLMGWIVLVALLPLYRTVSPSGFCWLVAGGVAYMVGSLVYSLKKPNPFPPHFGFHEIWHLFVLLGSFCQFMSVAGLVS